MKPDVAAQAFDPFFTTKPRGQGSGLGLAIVQGIISQAVGQIRIYSEPGLGSTVSVLLPAVNGAAPKIESRRHRKHVRSGMTVLIVEDEDARREVVSKNLLDRGYRVLTATTGAEALQIARRGAEELHILVTDVILPSGPGKELADQIQLLQPTMRALYLTGYARQLLVTSGTIDPGATVLEEPFSRGGLLAAVDELLSAS
jgi:CheY-like chemotaxis protein